MNLTIKNQIVGTRSYLNGIVTVIENGATTISRDLNVIIIGDAQFLFDVTNTNIIVNNGVKDLNPGETLLLAQSLSVFSTDPLATLFLYYSAQISIEQSASTVANSTVWSMRNSSLSPRFVIIERINLTASFHAATPLGRQTLKYDLRRFNTATPTGGTAVTAIQQDTLSSATGVSDIRVLDTGLTVTNVIFENPFAVISLPAVSGSVSSYIRDNMCFKLAAGEGIAIRLNTSALAGLSLTGEIIWSER